MKSKIRLAFKFGQPFPEAKLDSLCFDLKRDLAALKGDVQRLLVLVEKQNVQINLRIEELKATGRLETKVFGVEGNS